MSALFAGRVSERPFPKVFYALFAHRFGGTMTLEQDGRSWKVFWKDGLVVDAESASPEDSFPRAMVADGLMEVGQVGDLLRRMALEPTRKASEIFAAMKGLDEGAATKAARAALVVRARWVFGLPDAEYRCEEGEHTPVDSERKAPDRVIVCQQNSQRAASVNRHRQCGR